MKIPLLGELEMSALELLWQRGTADAKEVHSAIGVSRSITLSTIQSTLERLNRKRLLMRERVGHAYHYAPVLGRAEFRAHAMANALSDLRGADAAGVMAAFVDLVARTDRTKLDDLEKIIGRARDKRQARR